MQSAAGDRESLMPWDRRLVSTMMIACAAATFLLASLVSVRPFISGLDTLGFVALAAAAASLLWPSSWLTAGASMVVIGLGLWVEAQVAAVALHDADPALIDYVLPVVVVATVGLAHVAAGAAMGSPRRGRVARRIAALGASAVLLSMTTGLLAGAASAGRDPLPGNRCAPNACSHSLAPNIYLYPEQMQPVSVIAANATNITHSRPAYGSGWSVIARPSGAIDGVTDGYLFYDAEVNASWQTTRGWVVPASGWKDWMTAELPRLGLNQQETSDFIAAWTDTLRPAPYYLVAPQSQAVVDTAFPLQITPAPAQTLRIWFVIEPLQQPDAVVAPDLAAVAQRSGFTVVEWGVVGTLGMVRCLPEWDPGCGRGGSGA